MDNNDNKEQAAANAPMDQVREILFGAQLKDMEVRFKRQEERFAQEMNDIRDFFRKRLDSLENFMKSEVAGLLDRLRRESEEREAAQSAERKDRTEVIRNEERERQEAAARLSADLAGVAGTFERKLAGLSGALDAAERDLKSLLLSESVGLNDKVERKYADALKALAKTNLQIRSDMVYRAALSGLLAETVGGLAKPWNAEALGSAEGLEPAPAEDRPREEPAGEGQGAPPQAAAMGTADNY